MSNGLFSGQPGLSLGTGLYKTVSGLWSGASGLVMAFGGAGGTAALSFDFLSLTSLPSTITFSRGTQATLTNSAGKVTYAPNNVLTNSQDFEASAWPKSASTVSSNVTIAPDGTLTADKLAEDATTAAHFLNRAAATVNIPQIYSVYAKAAERTQMAMQLGTNAAYFDLSAGTVISGAGATITSVGNGWYRCAFASTPSNTNSQIYTAVGGSVTYAGTAGNGIYIWGAQLEAVTYQTTPSTYVSTTPANLLGYTQEFNNAAWNKAGATITANAAAAPNGYTTADALVEDATTGLHLTRQFYTFVTGTPYTLSVYVQASTRTWVQILLPAAAFTASQGGFFNLTGAGSLGTTTGTPTARTITDVGGGWYRITVTATSTAAAGGNVPIVAASADGTTSYAGSNGATALNIWGAQLSNSASVDPYVYNPGAAPSSTAYYGPRFDYDPITLAPKGLLIEEARTNLEPYSAQFDNVLWTQGAVTTTANVTASPDGTVSADSVVPSTATSAHSTYSSGINLATTTVYTFSVYAKANGYSWLRLAPTNGTGWSGSAPNAYFNIATGSVGTLGNGATATIQNAGNGWYRCIMTTPATSALATIGMEFLVASADNTISFAGNGTSGVYLWGAQLEAGAFATSYIPTVASTVTRSADVATMLGDNFSTWYNQSAGTFVADVQKFTPSATSTYAYELLGATSSFSMRVRLGTDGRMQSVDGGVVQVDTQIQTPVPATASKYAVAYAVNDYAGSANGGAVGTDTSATVPAITSLALGSAAVTNLYIQSISYYNSRLPDATLQTLTAPSTVSSLSLNFTSGSYSVGY